MDSSAEKKILKCSGIKHHKRHRKRPSIQIIGIDEGKEIEVKIRNVFNNNIEQNFPI